MDPVTVKFVQLILAEIAGFGLCIAGVYLFIRGVSGKSNLVIEGVGLKAKLSNAAPGGLIALLGVVVIALSLHSSVERTTTRHVASQTLEDWLQRSARITDATPQSQLTQLIVGEGDDRRFRVDTKVLDKPATLESLAQENYGDPKFWRLIAVVNKDRGYFALHDATNKQAVAVGQVIEIWLPSAYDGMTTEERVKVSGVNRTAAYDEWLAQAEAGKLFDPLALIDAYRKRELDVAYTEVPRGTLVSLREISIKYYGDGKYWPIVKWANADELPADANASTPPPAGRILHVLHFIGWPR